MTVLPNAPIDADTGLPVPTIAVATQGGVSIIKDDGSVVDITSNGYSGAHQLGLVGQRVYYSNIGTQVVYSLEIPESDVNFSAYNSLTSGSITRRAFSSLDHGGFLSQKVRLLGTNASSNYKFSVNSSNKAFGSSETGYGSPPRPGLTLLDENMSSQDNSMVSYINSDYNTGWMNGDIKLATLSDTDTTNVTYANLITNGTFDSNITGWSNFAGSVAHDTTAGGRIAVTSNGSYYGGIQTLTAVAGKTYALTFTAVSGTTGARIRAGNASSGTNYLNAAVADGTHTYFFTTDTTTVRIFLSTSGASGTCYFDNITLSLAEEDRSYNNNGLQVFGTVTKTAVATGAELVGYTQSGTSYLRQPSAGSLTLTSDFSITWWQKYDGSGGTYEGWQIVEDDTSSATAYDKVVLSAMHEISSSQYLIRGVSITASGVDNGIASGAWTCMTITKIGGKINLYTNGKLSSTTAGTCATPSNAYSLEILRWKYEDGSYYANDSAMALFRTSNTVPSEEQIAKMYNDEKHLFQENAKATLYGSSDAVTALAYDDDTELLHVGTSAGRSVFQGLNRVDNTTDAVDTAISASNGFIVED